MKGRAGSYKEHRLHGVFTADHSKKLDKDIAGIVANSLYICLNSEKRLSLLRIHMRIVLIRRNT